MAIFKTFYVLRHATEKKTNLKAKTFDIESIESWEYVSDDYTKVTMKSGDRFTVKYPILDFGDLVCAFVDGYGKLFTFNTN